MYEVESFYLCNGLKVIMHKIPGIRTISCGVWVNQGSKYETDETNGISHLIEHLLMSAENTNNEAYKNIMNRVNFSGVEYNATTTKEYTYYYFTGLNSMLDLCLDALANIVMFNKDIIREKFELEKDIVVQEALSYYSSYNQIAERTSQALWGNLDIGRIIVGNIPNIKEADLEYAKEIIDSSYTPENSTLIIIGDIDYTEALKLIEEKFSMWEDTKTREYTEVVNSMPGIYLNNGVKSSSSVISVGFRLNSNYKERTVPIEIISTILGHPGLDSRIVKKVRLEKGLAYSVNSFTAKYNNRGSFAISAITENTNVEEVIKLIMEEIQKAKEGSFTAEEIMKAKNILETQAILKLNDLNKHIKYLGNCSVGNNIFSLENEIRQIKKCSNEMIQSSLQEIFNDENIGVAAIGQFNSNNIVELITM